MWRSLFKANQVNDDFVRSFYFSQAATDGVNSRQLIPADDSFQQMIHSGLPIAVRLINSVNKINKLSNIRPDRYPFRN